MNQRTERILRVGLICWLFGHGLTYVFGSHHWEMFEGLEDPAFRWMGVVFGLGGLAVMGRKSIPKGIIHGLVVLSFLISLSDSIAEFIASGYLIEQFIEHGIKLGLPLVYLGYQHRVLVEERVLLVLKILVALTFIGHGLYALGWHYVPQGFLSMTRTILNLDMQSALTFLKVMGWLDLLAVLTLFVPGINRVGWYYVLTWGLITALARTVYGAEISSTPVDLLNFLGNTLYRIPHGSLALLFLLPAISNRPISANNNT